MCHHIFPKKCIFIIPDPVKNQHFIRFFLFIKRSVFFYPLCQFLTSHLHLNITYLLEADPEEHLSIKEDENSGVAWFTPEEALEKSTEPWFVERVYKKLIKKTNLLNGVRVNENEVRTE